MRWLPTTVYKQRERWRTANWTVWQECKIHFYCARQFPQPSRCRGAAGMKFHTTQKLDIAHCRTTGTTGSDLIATVNYHSSILLSRYQPTWTNTLPRHFCRGPANHKPFDFLPSIYPFYMFYTAKTFSVHRRVHNHCTKRILNLFLNRKKVLRRENDTLDKQNRGKTAAANPARYTFSTRRHRSGY